MKVDEVPNVIDHLNAWLLKCRSEAETDPIPPELVEQHFGPRDALADKIWVGWPAHFRPVLRGAFHQVWEELRSNHPDIKEGRGFDQVPLGLHPLVDAYVKKWRGHRLFGLEPVPPHNDEHFNGQDCLIAVSSDDLLRTQTEHFYGMSIWCPREDMARGEFNSGQFVLHSSG